MINLLVNAVEAVKEKESPRITLSAEILPNSKTILKISDNGMGMPPELLDKIFIPFFSTRKKRQRYWLKLMQANNAVCTKAPYRFNLLPESELRSYYSLTRWQGNFIASHS